MNSRTDAVIREIEKVIVGKREVVERVLMAVLSEGHILLDDVPGVGKTTLALACSRVMGMEYHRIQFTPDVVPSDIVGFSIYNKEQGTFDYKPGVVMTNLLLADEINRTSPKTQAALLEVMEEGRVTVDGVSKPVPSPFIVLATENPIGSAGTQMLPESQVDRFMICMTMGYPDMDAEIAIVKGKVLRDPLAEVRGVMTAADLTAMQQTVDGIYVHDVLYQYIGRLVQATRNHPLIELGLSPRGTIAITQMAKARAFLMNRTYSIPDDVEAVYLDVACHRVRLNSKARINRVTEKAVLEQILNQTAKPTVRRKQ